MSQEIPAAAPISEVDVDGTAPTRPEFLASSPDDELPTLPRLPAYDVYSDESVPSTERDP